MKRALVAAAAVMAAVSCAQEKERVRSAAEASAEAARQRGVAATLADAGVAETAKPVPPVATAAARPEAVAPAPDITQLPSGASLLVLPLNQNAIVNIQLRFRSGAVDDPPGKAGLTLLAARLMTEGGTASLDSKQLLNALFPLAAELHVRVDKEETTFRARVHKDNLEKVVPILTDVLLHPRWDPAEFKRLREAALNDVEKRLRQGDDENLGKESLSELMYRNHAYGRLTAGHMSDLKTLSLEDAKAQAARVFTADRLTVGVSGGYPPELPQRLAGSLSALPPRSEPPPAVPQARAHGPRFLLVEKVADSTAISLGFPFSLSHQDPDWPAMSIARSTFGEHRQTNGRLMQRLREARGLNYGDYAYIEHFEQEGYQASTAQTGRARRQQDFTIWLRPVRDENRLFALRAALYQLSRTLSAEPFSAEEVEQTKGFLDGYILLFDQTDARKLGYALDDSFYGMSGFLGSWRASLREVTAEQVNAAWKKWIDPARLQIAMAGKDMAAAKKIILSNERTPIRYQRDASGKTPEKPQAQLAEDQEIEAFPFGAQNDADVQIVPVEQMFE